MGVAVSLIVFAVGAILRFATNIQSSTWNIRTIGDILMIVGAVGFVVAVVAWASWDGFGPGRTLRRPRRVVEDGREPVLGPDGYARTTYGQGHAPYEPVNRAVGMPSAGDPTRPYGTVVEEEERSLY